MSVSVEVDLAGPPVGPRPLRFRLAAAAEVLAVFAACQIYLWRFSRHYRQGWLLILAFIVASIILRRQSAEKLGLTWGHAAGAARWMGAIVFLAALPLLIWGALRGRVGLLLPDAQALLQFGGYLGWCALQQFALQSYVHNRLLDAAPRAGFTSVMVGLLFGSLHLPNPVLTVATLAGGMLMAAVFVRHRNIWILALGQALISTVIFVSLPDAWHHRLRVGPGFHWWELRR